MDRTDYKAALWGFSWEDIYEESNCIEQGVATDYIEAAIAASLLFRREGEEPMTPEVILETVAGLSKDDAVYKRIMAIYEMLADKKPLSAVLAKIKAERNSAVIV